MNHKPFSDHFIVKANANGFYDNIRCGLLHEAATKQTSLIKRSGEYDNFVKFKDNDPSNMTVYSKNLYKAICDFIEVYKTELMTDKKLQLNFIRKIDGLCGIDHQHYFAYGSNLYPDRLLKRISHYHNAFPASLSNYEFCYNKKGRNGTAKANIKHIDGAIVHGVCFEIDSDDLRILDEVEKDYVRETVSLITKDDKKIKATTYTSSFCDNTLIPAKDYKELILKGAIYWDFDKSYIEKYLT